MLEAKQYPTVSSSSGRVQHLAILSHYKWCVVDQQYQGNTTSLSTTEYVGSSYPDLTYQAQQYLSRDIHFLEQFLSKVQVDYEDDTMITTALWGAVYQIAQTANRMNRSAYSSGSCLHLLHSNLLCVYICSLLCLAHAQLSDLDFPASAAALNAMPRDHFATAHSMHQLSQPHAISHHLNLVC